MFKKRKLEIFSKFDERKIILGPASANTFGQESLRVRQLRGNGLLLLTETELYFGMFLPRKDFRIPINLITKIEIAKSHLGKTKFRDLLKVYFTNNTGKEDSIAWLVKDLESWIKTLKSVIPMS